ncbi:MAG: hypothetical protein AAFY16_03055 [Cyanobacteria bacterium J06642_3]
MSTEAPEPNFSGANHKTPPWIRLPQNIDEVTAARKLLMGETPMTASLRFYGGVTVTNEQNRIVCPTTRGKHL